MHRFGEVLTVQCHAYLAGMDDDLRHRRGIVRDRVRIRAADDRDVAGCEPRRRVAVGHHPRVAVNHGDERERGFVLDAQ